MKFSGKVCFKVILKVTNQGFTLSLEDIIYEKTQGEGEGSNYPPPPQPF